MGHDMKIPAAIGAAFLGLVVSMPQAGSAGRAGDAAQAGQQAGESREVTALPPVGFVQFCARNPADCRPASRHTALVPMSGERWRAVYRVNSYVNARIVPMSDSEIYGEAEHWAYPEAAGDCEDYVLMKKRYLEKLGFARSALFITVVLDEKNEGHAVLTVVTDEGDFVLDNRRNEVRRWKDLDYTFLKRQSPRDPRQWVSLTKEKTFATGVVAGGTDK